MTLPLLNRTLAILRSPEFGFLGFVIPTRTHTPLSCGLSTMAGDVTLRALCATRQPLSTWLSVVLTRAVLEKVRWVGGAADLAMTFEGTLRQPRNARGSRKKSYASFDAIVAVLWMGVRCPESKLMFGDCAQRIGEFFGILQLLDRRCES